MKPLRLLATLLTVFLIFSHRGISQDSEISFSANLSKSDIKFEETTDLDITVKWWGDKSRYIFEAFPLPETQNLMVKGTSTAISSGTENGKQYISRTYKYTLQPTDAGVGAIEPITLKYIEMPDSIPGELTTQRFQVLIAAPKIVPQKDESDTSLIFILGGIILLGVVVVIVIFIRAGNKKPKEIKKTPEETFLEELAEIKKETGTERKLLYSRLYKLLVGYIAEKYGIGTTGRTTRDIADDLEKSDMEPERKEKLGTWLILADKEKYAPHAGKPGDTIRLTTEMEKYFQDLNKSK